MVKGTDYIGKVVYIDDVTHTGRCKIRVFGVLDALADENLPWFSPGNTSVFSSNGAGSIDIPKVGSIVRVRFLNDDYYSGEYFNLPMLDPSLVKEIEDDYENTHVLLYDGDQEILIIYQPMTGIKIFHKDSTFIIDPTGNIQLKHANNSNVIEINDDGIIITSAKNGSTNGKVEISAGDTVSIKAKTIRLESDNIILGPTGGGHHVAIAEEVASSLKQLVGEIATKFPLGSKYLAEEWNNMKDLKTQIH